MYHSPLCGNNPQFYRATYTGDAILTDNWMANSLVRRRLRFGHIETRCHRGHQISEKLRIARKCLEQNSNEKKERTLNAYGHFSFSCHLFSAFSMRPFAARKGFLWWLTLLLFLLSAAASAVTLPPRYLYSKNTYIRMAYMDVHQRTDTPIHYMYHIVEIYM